MNSPARHLALATPTTSRKPRNTARALLGSALLLVMVSALALTGVGSTYAMWNKNTAVNASTVTSASTGLTINGSTTYTIPALGLANLAPGQSIMVPLTLANTGTTKLSTAVTGVTILTNSKGLSNELTLRATQSATCNASTTAGTRLANFTTVSAPVTMAVGASAPLCLELKMDVDAPMSVSGGSTTFTLNLTATQVRGA
ncbi:hypothetical protein B0I08_11257 [Glaciihabitans tibetensis]|uniref:Ribosomally synthesized peptide with SipW-like signal peptide n=1 Tax=Glaciihabitans tibetensis TaxID=1266600 RepID=A0A2T0V3C8_9MICO|nr:hypothetical protein [Glaciihabitans tibetensis]PRY64672.1 hypothetical protein B0I08_11257 [Glaciihabitans tibetensis]